MRIGRTPASSFVQRPSVTATIPYVGLCGIWFLWILATARAPLIGDPGPFRLITLGQYAGVSALNALFVVFLAVDGYLARKSPPGLRRGHLAGVALALLAVLLIQLGLFHAWGPIVLGQG